MYDCLEPMKPPHLSAEQAAKTLGISLPTLYAYVSRGLIRSEAVGGSKRNRRYREEDIRALKQRKELRRNPAKAVETALHWGEPVMESAITLIADGRLYYVSRNRGTFVVAAKPKFELLAHNKIEDDKSVFNGSPAVSGGRLFLRSDKYLYCIGKD